MGGDIYDYEPGAKIEILGFPGLDLTRIDPADVPALDEYFRSHHITRLAIASLAIRERFEDTEPSMHFALQATLDVLPERNLKFGRLVLGEYAGCPLDDFRGDAARRVSAFARLDHDYGLRLWDRLVRDENDEVREQGIRAVRSCLKTAIDLRPSPHKRIPELGITWEEAGQLAKSHNKAERGKGIVEIKRPKGYDEEWYRLNIRVRGYASYLRVANLALPAGA